MDKVHLRIVDALDGVTYASADVPVGSPFLADPQASHFGLLDLSSTQDPPGLLSHVELHVQGLISAPDHTASQVQVGQPILKALDTVAHHLQTVRADAQKLVFMSNDQLSAPSALGMMNDLVTNATAAFVGEPDDTTGTTTGGITETQSRLQRLAVVPVLPDIHS